VGERRGLRPGSRWGSLTAVVGLYYAYLYSGVALCILGLYVKNDSNPFL
jgi:hypothetical protein